MHHPIRIYKDQLIRLYVLNIIEYDPAVTFHLHANFFDVYRYADFSRYVEKPRNT